MFARPLRLSSARRLTLGARACTASLPARRRLATAATELARTGLYDFHVEHGAKMVPFAGYAMPLQYGAVGQVAAHNHVRTEAGLFDVGHMVQTNFRGPSATAFLEWLTPSSLGALPPYGSTLSVLLNERGGIIDDTVITKHAHDAYYVVTNAGRRERDLAWLRTRLEEWNSSERGAEGHVEMEVLEGWGLLALQGPKAAEYLQALTSFDLRGLTFGKAAFVPMEGFNLHVARGGYTGEDGFEISVPPAHAVEVARMLAKSPVALTGLGARDSLRLEAGMCLYGQDLDEDTTPVEAGLSWGKDRKEAGGFIGCEAVQEHLREGPPRRRVGLIVEGAPARQGAQVSDSSSGEVVVGHTAPLLEYLLTLTIAGVVTSGIPSPTLGKNIAMGYVRNGLHKKGTSLAVDVRGKPRDAVVAPMPFVPSRYWRG